MQEFLLRALLGGIGVTLMASALGCFVVWRRLAYFGVALSHSALLGAALGLLLGIGTTTGIAVLCLAIALAFAWLEERRAIAGDALLGVLAHVALASGIIVVSFMETLRVDLMAYLFGDILSLSWVDVGLIYGLAALTLVALGWLWRPLLSATVHDDLARVEGVPTFRVRLAFTLLLAVVVAVGMKVVGLLMIVALLIIPAAAARRISATPEAMALLAALIGVGAVLGGIAGSWTWDMPSGPAIVVCAALVFALLSVLPRPRRRAAAGDGTARRHRA
ncbi:MAG TPA: iron chelate uptake ABC transporter family permease subunit [Alphaproteobacteria bacterium]|nr:iron chelate uptake ABC transporter family permease subunit [Alphaproteobacteria bacterium]